MPPTGRLLLAPTGSSGPTVTLTRVASGIGTLSCEAAVSPEVGDVLLSCAFKFSSGLTSLLQRDGNSRQAPHDSRTPALIAGRDQFSRVLVDLRQVRDLERLVLIVHSASRSPLAWAGTVVVTDHTGDRIEVPLNGLGESVAGAAVSIYQVDGELVLRSELVPAASVREAAVAFGFDDITWLDDHTPFT